MAVWGVCLWVFCSGLWVCQPWVVAVPAIRFWVSCWATQQTAMWRPCGALLLQLGEGEGTAGNEQLCLLHMQHPAWPPLTQSMWAVEGACGLWSESVSQ